MYKSNKSCCVKFCIKLTQLHIRRVLPELITTRAVCDLIKSIESASGMIFASAVIFKFWTCWICISCSWSLASFLLKKVPAEDVFLYFQNTEMPFSATAIHYQMLSHVSCFAEPNFAWTKTKQFSAWLHLFREEWCSKNILSHLSSFANEFATIYSAHNAQTRAALFFSPLQRSAPLGARFILRLYHPRRRVNTHHREVNYRPRWRQRRNLF